MYTLLDLLVVIIPGLIIGFVVGHYVGWHMCKAKTETDRFFEQLKSEEQDETDNAK
jgi:anaerobic C4-dicarboxylate transporter